ncbi:MAG: hypothetical protein ABGX16_16735, partial [Pirellulales bacterium]
RHFVAIAVSKPQPESRALADCRRPLRLQAVVFIPIAGTFDAMSTVAGSSSGISSNGRFAAW